MKTIASSKLYYLCAECLEAVHFQRRTGLMVGSCSRCRAIKDVVVAASPGPRQPQLPLTVRQADKENITC